MSGDIGVEMSSYDELVERWTDVFNAIGDRMRFKIMLLVYANELLNIGDLITFSYLKHALSIEDDSLLKYNIDILKKTGLIGDTPVYKTSKKWDEFLEGTGLKNSLDKTVKDLTNYKK